jgi:hypothetical protein
MKRFASSQMEVVIRRLCASSLVRSPVGRFERCAFSVGCPVALTFQSLPPCTQHTSLCLTDPDRLSFEDICERFFAEATPNIRRRQYLNALFAQCDSQAETALLAAEKAGKAGGVPVLPACAWHDAEERHQHYYEKQAAPRASVRI